MRSQKQNNRPPRPFKNQHGSGRWSGSQAGGGFIPPPKFPQPAKKQNPPPPEKP